MTQAFIYSWNFTSESAAELAKATSFRRIRHEGSTFKGHPEKKVINWGSRTCPPEILKCKLFNSPQLIEKAANKLSFFKLMDVKDGPRIPSYTEEPTTALEWLAAKSMVCVRKTVNGHSAAGLSIISGNNIDDLVKAPLYTRYIAKKDEYRIHYAFGKVIDIQRKALRKQDDNGNPIDKANVNWRIRNLANGFVYARNDLRLPDDVMIQAEKCFPLTKLDFGAIDIIWNEKEKKAYILEINTAPGLCNTTVQSYAKAFKKEI